MVARTSGRQLYGILGSYIALEKFIQSIKTETLLNGSPFPEPISVNRGILDEFSDETFHNMVLDEAKHPEPILYSIQRTFEKLLRKWLKEKKLLILKDLELLFAYEVDLNLLHTLASDEDRIILLLPGKRENDRVIMFPNYKEWQMRLPLNIIPENRLWEVTS